MKKNFLMLILLGMISSCVFAQNKVDKFFGNLRGGVQIYERYESLYKSVRRMNPNQISDYGTRIKRKFGSSRLESLTWSSMQIERHGPYLYVFEVDNGEFICIGKVAMTINHTYPPYEVYVLRGDMLYRYQVVIVTMGGKGYVYFKTENNRTLESYTFDK